VAYFVLTPTLGMSNRHPKAVLATFLVSMLLYYSAAWALLRCCHETEPVIVEQSMSVADLHGALRPNFSPPNQTPTQIDCLDFDYQSAVLASPASPPQLHRVTATIAWYVTDFFILKSLADGHGKSSPGSVFTRGSPPAEPSDPPLYLSLAALRI